VNEADAMTGLAHLRLLLEGATFAHEGLCIEHGCRSCQFLAKAPALLDAVEAAEEHRDYPFDPAKGAALDAALAQLAAQAEDATDGGS
jgi:hypothetical protein